MTKNNKTPCDALWVRFGAEDEEGLFREIFVHCSQGIIEHAESCPDCREKVWELYLRLRAVPGGEFAEEAAFLEDALFAETHAFQGELAAAASGDMVCRGEIRIFLSGKEQDDEFRLRLWQIHGEYFAEFYTKHPLEAYFEIVFEDQDGNRHVLFSRNDLPDDWSESWTPMIPVRIIDSFDPDRIKRPGFRDDIYIKLFTK